MMQRYTQPGTSGPVCGSGIGIRNTADLESRIPHARTLHPERLESELEPELHQALIVAALSRRRVVGAVDQRSVMLALPNGVGGDHAVHARDVLRVEEVLRLEEQLARCPVRSGMNRE